MPKQYPPQRYPWRDGRQLTIDELVALPECVVDRDILRRRLVRNMPVSRAVMLPPQKPGGAPVGGRFRSFQLKAPQS